MALPIVEHYIQLKNETASLFISHRKLILVTTVILVSLALFGMWAMRVRSTILANMNAPKKSAPVETSMVVLPTISSPSAYMDVLGTSDDITPSDVGSYTTYPTPTPYPVITLTPIPTPTPIQVVTSTATSCAGTPTVDNSQVYVSPSTTQVGSTATINVVLQDCNNSVAPVSDSLTITLSNGDAGTKINGASSPVTIQTQNGKATFTVSSQNATTATFIITDTTRSFPVTTPGYHNPSVTFTNGSSGNTNCTTSAGAPNAWYSDVYPNPPITTTTGSVTLQVVIRDCNKNTTSVSDTLNISLSSGDSGTQVNGNSLPYSLSAQNGQANFTVSSGNAGTVTLIVTDTTSSFTITDANNHNPSISFNGSSTSTPTPTPATTDTPTPTPTGAVTPTIIITPTPTPTPTPGS